MGKKRGGVGGGGGGGGSYSRDDGELLFRIGFKFYVFYSSWHFMAMKTELASSNNVSQLLNRLK